MAIDPLFFESPALVPGFRVENKCCNGSVRNFHISVILLPYRIILSSYSIRNLHLAEGPMSFVAAARRVLMCSNKRTVQEIIDGYIDSKRASRISEHTLADYSNTFRKFAAYVGQDSLFDNVRAELIESFLAEQNQISDKTLLNYWIGLSSLWSWAVKRGIVSMHVVHMVEPPKPESRDILPFADHEVMHLLHAANHRAGNELRDVAILYLLLDTGMRASEITSCTIEHIHDREMLVFGKGKKERWLPFSEETHTVLYRYLDTRKDLQGDTPLLLSSTGAALTRSGLLQMCKMVGKLAGVAKCHPHRFRHTFATNYLLAGGDPYSLQRMLGHATMLMVNRYLEISRANLRTFHARASPVKYLLSRGVDSSPAHGSHP